MEFPDQYSRFHLKIYQSLSVFVIGASFAKTPPQTVSQQCTHMFCHLSPGCAIHSLEISSVKTFIICFYYVLNNNPNHRLQCVAIQQPKPFHHSRRMMYRNLRHIQALYILQQNHKGLLQCPSTLQHTPDLHL